MTQKYYRVYSNAKEAKEMKCISAFRRGINVIAFIPFIENTAI